ncbi:MAG: DUF86 domain-containing protein [Candidatus Omnitrophica bacterium]|nr:DUF86 domain-containing protein [Candidatus Omnitrophota bacterium]
MSRDKAHLLDILSAAKRIQEVVSQKTLGDFRSDWILRSAILHQFLIMGEATKRLTIQIREDYPDVPWKRIAGFRDVLIHGYDIVDEAEVWETATHRIVQVIETVEEILKKG